MQPNTKTQNPAKKMKQIIAKIYDEVEKQLSLCGYYGDWRGVLEFQDWSALCVLYLRNCHIGDYGAEFVGSLSWPNLRSLYIARNRITAVGAKKLLMKQFPQLETLNLDMNEIGDEGMQVLSSTQNLPQLNLLRVRANHISAVGLIQMPNSKINRLKEFQLCLFFIIQSRTTSAVVFDERNEQNNFEIILNSNKSASCITGIKLLVKAELPLLELLQLGGCQLGSEGVKQLPKGNWQNLSYLQINGNRIKLPGCTAIADSNWSQLKKITVCWPQDGTGAVAALSLVAANWPSKCKVMLHFTLWTQEEDEKEEVYEKVKNVLKARFNQQE